MQIVLRGCPQRDIEISQKGRAEIKIMSGDRKKCGLLLWVKEKACYKKRKFCIGSMSS